MPPQSYSSSPRCFELITSWFNEWFTHHDECGGSSRPVLPTRIILITKSSPTPLLRLTSDKDSKAYYVDFSHCWGSGLPALQTTIKNRRTMEQDVPWSSLLKTFQDAVLVSLHLGIRYIWTDSLCIIQDDLVDWESECTGMCNSHCGYFQSSSSANISRWGIPERDTCHCCNQPLLVTERVPWSPKQHGRLFSNEWRFSYPWCLFHKLDWSLRPSF
jgi:hypothetical protein